MLQEKISQAVFVSVFRAKVARRVVVDIFRVDVSSSNQQRLHNAQVAADTRDV
jgi:hypothetical protein